MMRGGRRVCGRRSWVSFPAGLHSIVMGDVTNATETNGRLCCMVIGSMFPRNVDVMLRFSANSSSFSSCAEIRNHRTFQADESKVVMREILEDPTVMSCLLHGTLSPISIVG